MSNITHLLTEFKSIMHFVGPEEVFINLSTTSTLITSFLGVGVGVITVSVNHISFDNQETLLY